MKQLIPEIKHEGTVINSITMEMLIPNYVIEARSDFEAVWLGYVCGRVDRRKFKRYFRRYVKAYGKWKKKGGVTC